MYRFLDIQHASPTKLYNAAKSSVYPISSLFNYTLKIIATDSFQTTTISGITKYKYVIKAMKTMKQCNIFIIDFL